MLCHTITSHRARTHRLGLTLLTSLLFLPLIACAQVQRPSTETLALAQQRVEAMLVVDCMLPGQVRRLGAQMSYLSPRRPAKLSAEECSLRGGEYVMYDRADLASALSVWLTQANAGDSEAQTYVGEIYERGLGGAQPSYTDAAQWYQKAAGQGHSRAMTNLGFLYEKGLGVARDPAKALSLYRKANGLGDIIALEGMDAAAREQEIQTLKRELDTVRRELEEARRTLDTQREQTGVELRRLEGRIASAQHAGDSSLVAELNALLRKHEIELDARARQVGELSATADHYRRELETLTSETASLREQLERTRARLAESEAEQAARQGRAKEDQSRLSALQSQLEQARNAADNDTIRRLEAQLRLSEGELARQRDELARVERESRQFRQQLVELESRGQSEVRTTAVAIAPPSIQVIDPPVMLTRSQATVRVRGNTTLRDVVGKVTAPAGLLSFAVNDSPQSTDELGMFKVSVPMMGAATPVSLVAVDRQGKRSELEFTLVPEGDVALQSARPTPPRYVSSINFGRYHALVIGNEAYRHLPKLETAVSDARAIADVLQRKYGYRVRLITNATRYEILSALNELRKELTDQDNLLIYYAGHGEIDRANQRGHWLPVDAEPNSAANWISNVDITDLLNAMSAKHALVVADSCYSGTLTRSSMGNLEAGISDEARAKWLRAIVQSRVRAVLSSGGVQPVLDGGGGNHSVFARALLDVLQDNEDAIEAQRVYQEIAARVLDRASRLQIEQRPEYAPLRFAGHESGDFIFVPSGLLVSR